MSSIHQTTAIHIEPWHLALGVCDWIENRSAELQAPEVLVGTSTSARTQAAELLVSDSRNTARRYASVIFTPVLLAAVWGSGCSGERLPVQPVSGQVTFEQQWPLGAKVVLHPVADQISVRPSGTVDALGNFQLTTYRKNDGAPVGEYVATVEWRPYIIDGEDYKPGPNVLPKSYADVSTSPLKVNVVAGTNVVPPFTLSLCGEHAFAATPGDP